MIDIRKLKYKLIVMIETGTQLDVTEATQDLGWEEGEGELAMRLSFSVENTKYKGRFLSELIKPGCMAVIIADWGIGMEEVARGIITDWEPELSASKDAIAFMAYDELFNLQQSQDNRYIPDGTGTKAAITAILGDWGIPIGEYKGPNISHAKTAFKNDYLGDVILELLDAAVKQGGAKCVVRASKGKVSVLPIGSNETIYCFAEDENLTVARDRISTQSMVTRVKVVATENEDGRQAVEAIIDGQTKYGIRQRIYNREEDDNLATAKATAQEIIDEEGSPERNINVGAPDVPTIRKGDKVHVAARTMDGYFIVKAVQHDAANCTMTMTIEPMEKPLVAVPEQQKPEKATSNFEKGDKVILNGAVYVDSYGNGKGMTFTNRTCTITIKVDTSRPCPYHVDGIGWVYPNTISKS